MLPAAVHLLPSAVQLLPLVEAPLPCKVVRVTADEVDEATAELTEPRAARFMRREGIIACWWLLVLLLVDEQAENVLFLLYPRTLDGVINSA